MCARSVDYTCSLQSFIQKEEETDYLKLFFLVHITVVCNISSREQISQVIVLKPTINWRFIPLLLSDLHGGRLPRATRGKFACAFDPPSNRHLPCLFPINKLTSVFYASVLLLMINFVITLSTTKSTSGSTIIKSQS